MESLRKCGEELTQPCRTLAVTPPQILGCSPSPADRGWRGVRGQVLMERCLSPWEDQSCSQDTAGPSCLGMESESKGQAGTCDSGRGSLRVPSAKRIPVQGNLLSSFPPRLSGAIAWREGSPECRLAEALRSVIRPGPCGPGSSSLPSSPLPRR